jgi:hypothetical protein
MFLKLSVLECWSDGVLELLDFGSQIADFLYRFALSFYIRLIRRPATSSVESSRTLNPNSKIQNPQYIRKVS